jgi:hypothetical protein
MSFSMIRKRNLKRVWLSKLSHLSWRDEKAKLQPGLSLGTVFRCEEQNCKNCDGRVRFIYAY